MQKAKRVTTKAKDSLSVERIETAALALIEAEGMAAFSTRKLAAALHCEAMSIYHYFPSKDHLLDALVDRVMRTEMTVLVPEPGKWREQIEFAAGEWRALALRRPHFFGYLAMHRLNTPMALLWLNGMLALFRALGLGDEYGARMFRIMGFYLTGAMLEETAGYWRGHSTVAPVQEDVMRERYPDVVAAAPWFQEPHWPGTFTLGLEALLDAIERDLARSSA